MKSVFNFRFSAPYLFRVSIFVLGASLLLPSVASAATITASLKPAFQADLTTTLKLQAGTGNPTFTRATTATVQDWEGLIKNVLSGEARFTGARRVQNLVTNSEKMDQWVSGNIFNNTAYPTVTQNAITAPDGTMTADTVTWGGSLQRVGSTITSTFAPASSKTYRASIWLRAVSGTVSDVSVNIRDGDAGGGGTEVATITPTITTQWQRFSLTQTFSSSARVNAGWYLSSSGTSQIYAWGVQMEDVTGQSNQNPSEYVSCGVLAAPYHGAGADCVQYFNTKNGNTVASNVVTAGTGAKITSATAAAGAAAGAVDATGPLGYLAEGARTNISPYSNSFGNWVLTNANVAATAAIAPDGTLAAQKLQETNVTGLFRTYEGINSANGVYTVSVFVKAAERTVAYVGMTDGATGTVGTRIDLTNGTISADTTSAGSFTGISRTVSAFPNGWYRVTITATSNAGTQIIPVFNASDGVGTSAGTNYAGVTGDGIYLWGGQLEQAPFASSYIPTTTGSATRNADVLTYPTGNISTVAGSSYAEITKGSTYYYLVAKIINGGNNYGNFLGSTYAPYVEVGNNTDSSSVTTSFGSTPMRLASSWGSRLVVAAAGALGTPVNTVGTMVMTELSIGSRGGIEQPFGTIRNVKIWKKVLSDTQLTAMTSTNTAVARAAVPQTTIKAPTGTGLVGYWKLDEGTGTRANDSSGLGNFGTLVGSPTWTTGKLGKALSFNGSGQYMTTPITESAGQALTVVALAYSTESAANYRNIFDSAAQYPMIWWNTSGKIEFDATGFTTSATYRNQWVQVALVKPAGNSVATYYVNGVAVGTTGFTYSVAAATPTWFNRAGAQAWLGKADDVRYYNRALSATEISALYKSTAAVVNAPTNNSLTSGLAGLWSFDGKDTQWTSATAGTALDRSGQGNNGTLTNMSQSTSPTIGKIGQALKFNGTSSYLGVPDSTSLHVANNFSVATWVNYQTPDATQTLFGKKSTWNGTDGFYIERQAGKYVVIGSSGTSVTITASQTAGTWYHLVFVISGASVTAYINGVAQSVTGSISSVVANATNLAIGQFGTGVSFLNGKMDDARIYNRALSATEVKSLYNLGR